MRSVTFQSLGGAVDVRLPYCQDAEDGLWHSPVREKWGLAPRQRMTPELEERLCLNATVAGSFEAGAELARRWGVPTDDSTIHRHIQRAGERARESEQGRVRQAAVPARREEMRKAALGTVGAKDQLLALMGDGWMARERGPAWGAPEGTEGERAVWREVKSGIVFRVVDATAEKRARPVLAKAVLHGQGDWDDVGERVRAEALRRGMDVAKEVLFGADGSPGIWAMKERLFSSAAPCLDFHHAASHVVGAAKSLHGEATGEAARWADSQLHLLRHGGEDEFRSELSKAAGQAPPGEASETLRRAANYFDEHKDATRYADLEERGWPIGTGAMESANASAQNRMKRTGQFWTGTGKGNMLALLSAKTTGIWQGCFHHEAVRD